MKAIGDEVPISSQLHTLPPPAPALPQTQSDKKKKKTTVDQISYSIPPAQLSLGGNSYLITALSPYGKWSPLISYFLLLEVALAKALSLLQ